VAGRFFLAQGFKAKGYFGFGMRVGSGTERVAERVCGYSGVMLAFPSSNLLWKATTGGLVVS
jgi:hypothetical protein